MSLERIQNPLPRSAMAATASRRRPWRWIGALLVPAVLAGCQGAAPTGLDAVAKRGTLRALVFGSDAPYSEKTDSGFQGLSVTVLDAIATELNDTLEPAKPIKLKIESAASAEDGLARIRSGEADIACGVAFSWKRQQEVDYTLPFAMGGVRLLAPAGNDGTPEALSGQKVGVVDGTVAAEKLRGLAPEADYVSFATPKKALAALQSGEIQFLGGDSLWLKANQKAVAPNSELVPMVPYGRAGVGCIVAQSNPKLRILGSIAIGRLMQGYIDNDASAVNAINRWVGPGSAVGLSPELISRYYTVVLSTVAEFAKS